MDEELRGVTSTCAKFAQVQTEGNRKVKREIEYYNLNVIISVGYRVKSSQGMLFDHIEKKDIGIYSFLEKANMEINLIQEKSFKETKDCFFVKKFLN